MNHSHYVLLQLGALLQSINVLSENTLSQRITETSTLCPELDLQLLDELLTLTKDDDLSNIVREADEIVGITPQPEILKLPLKSVSSRIELRHPSPKTLAYHQVPWSTDTDEVFPVEPDKVRPEGEKCLQQFVEKFLTFFQTATNFNALYAGTLSLVDEYLWCIPADKAQDDVPLSEVLRLKSAVAACLFKRVESQETGNPETPFTLVVGDLSGIQKYVFGITEGGKSKSGTGKRLRSRSLFVQLLAEVGIQKVLEVYELPPANVLMASGGRFHILWPNFPEENKKSVIQLREQINKWLLDELHGEIGLTLAIASVKQKEIQEGFGDVFEQVRTALHDAKNRKLRTLLQNNEVWNEESFTRSTVKFPHGVCPSCERFPATGAGEYCRHCALDEKIGEKVAHQAKWLAFYHQKIDEESLPVLEDYVSVLKTKDENQAEPYLLLQLGGEVDVSKSSSKTPTLWRPSAPYIGELDFVTMARNAEGRELLGYLKADVDHVGAIFRCGFKDSHTSSNGLSPDIPARFSTLSRQLDRFFGLWLSRYLRGEYPNSYTVFAGGDDVFIIGPWNEMIELAQNLQERFCKFVGKNKNVTLSVGIAFVKPRYPLGQAAGYAENVLKKANLRIGGNKDEIEIGGMDNPVIRHPVTKHPYIPGSSLKGKLRSLLEYKYGKVTNDGKPCGCTQKDFPICIMFGPHIQDRKKQNHQLGPTRILLRDAMMRQESVQELESMVADGLLYAEVKTENIIDRKTGRAADKGLRTQERVPAGAEFNFRLTLRVFEGDSESQMLSHLAEGLRLLQADYLGSSGSRGYGQIEIRDMKKDNQPWSFEGQDNENR